MSLVKVDTWVKSEPEIQIMIEGGKKLAQVKKALQEKVIENISSKEIDDLAEKLIIELGGAPSFKMVPNYYWTTCVNIGSGVVHGIPKKEVVFKKGDLVSVDVGIYYKGFHTDTSFSKAIEADQKTNRFLDAGKEALNNAIKKAQPGNRIYDISLAIEETLEKHHLNPVRVLVGHGVGRNLHEEPQIPGFASGNRKDSPLIPENCALAIEVIYTEGSGEVFTEDDGWTISTVDDKISALFEETIIVKKNGPLIITK